MTADTYLQLGGGNKDIVLRVEEIAKKHEASMAQVALAWVMAKDGQSSPCSSLDLTLSFSAT